MLQRRLMIAGGIVAPAIVRMSSMMPISILASRMALPRVAPAIVPASSLMPVSPIPKLIRFIARMQASTGGGSTTFVGEAPIEQDWSNLTAVLQSMIGTWICHRVGHVPWGDTLNAGGDVRIHILKALQEGESALPWLT